MALTCRITWKRSTLTEPTFALDSNEAGEGDAGADRYEEEEYEKYEDEEELHGAELRDAVQRGAVQLALRDVQVRYAEQTGRTMDAAQYETIQALVRSPSATVQYLVNMAMAHDANGRGSASID